MSYPFSLVSLRLQKEEHCGEEHDTCAHYHCVILHAATLELPEEPGAFARACSNPIDSTINDESVEEPRSVPEDVDRQMTNAVDNPIDNVCVDPGKDAAEQHERSNDDRLVELVNVVLVLQNSVHESKSVRETTRA